MPGGTPARARDVSRIGRTPLVPVRLKVAGRWREVGLKLEQFNPGGSVKDRTAYALVEDMEDRGLLGPGRTVVESTSGNLGAALAYVCRSRGYPFVAVVDPKTSRRNLDEMAALAAAVERVDLPDAHGGYLRARLRRVRDLLASDPTCVWPDQYRNPANPRVHREQTGPEILRHGSESGSGSGGGSGSGCPDAVFVAVSTGGTLAGVAQYLRMVAPECHVVAVDVRGSVALGGPPGRRRLTGIGAGRPSDFARPGDCDQVRHVPDAEAVAACQVLRAQTGVGVGGSSGAVLAAAARYLTERPEAERVVCLCADGADRYEDTLYSGAWLREHGFTTGTTGTAAAARAEVAGLAFDAAEIV
ncbi:pyridoxal-phosphate dependent enzyme [Streptomyces kanamyceticus]|uniref:pyridoxal-phosphate dependent enzyme n=1 Tax=Streptomyces kanamyceticus TaxID=1967 RepID=UPI0012FEB740|nr:pyridoxal-phosphate dependent enzyme [Streptomyces kanamyceticus]